METKYFSTFAAKISLAAIHLICAGNGLRMKPPGVKLHKVSEQMLSHERKSALDSHPLQEFVALLLGFNPAVTVQNACAGGQGCRMGHPILASSLPLKLDRPERVSSQVRMTATLEAMDLEAVGVESLEAQFMTMLRSSDLSMDGNSSADRLPLGPTGRPAFDRWHAMRFWARMHYPEKFSKRRSQNLSEQPEYYPRLDSNIEEIFEHPEDHRDMFKRHPKDFMQTFLNILGIGTTTLEVEFREHSPGLLALVRLSDDPLLELKGLSGVVGAGCDVTEDVSEAFAVLDLLAQIEEILGFSPADEDSVWKLSRTLLRQQRRQLDADAKLMLMNPPRGPTGRPALTKYMAANLAINTSNPELALRYFMNRLGFEGLQENFTNVGSYRVKAFLSWMQISDKGVSPKKLLAQVGIAPPVGGGIAESPVEARQLAMLDMFNQIYKTLSINLGSVDDVDRFAARLKDIPERRRKIVSLLEMLSPIHEELGFDSATIEKVKRISLIAEANRLRRKRNSEETLNDDNIGPQSIREPAKSSDSNGGMEAARDAWTAMEEDVWKANYIINHISELNLQAKEILRGVPGSQILEVVERVARRVSSGDIQNPSGYAIRLAQQAKELAGLKSEIADMQAQVERAAEDLNNTDVQDRLQSQNEIAGAAGPVSQKRTGTLVKDRGTFGFILQDNGGGEIFVMPNAFGEFGFKFPSVGTRVQFDLVPSKDGRARADNVEPEPVPEPELVSEGDSVDVGAALQKYPEITQRMNPVLVEKLKRLQSERVVEIINHIGSKTEVENPSTYMVAAMTRLKYVESNVETNPRLRECLDDPVLVALRKTAPARTEQILTDLLSKSHINNPSAYVKRAITAFPRKRSEGNESDPTAYRSIQKKKGDWRCPICRDLNFAKNDVCRNCKRPKTLATNNVAEIYASRRVRSSNRRALTRELALRSNSTLKMLTRDATAKLNVFLREMRCRTHYELSLAGFSPVMRLTLAKEDPDSPLPNKLKSLVGVGMDSRLQYAEALASQDLLTQIHKEIGIIPWSSKALQNWRHTLWRDQRSREKEVLEELEMRAEALLELARSSEVSYSTRESVQPFRRTLEEASLVHSARWECTATTSVFGDKRLTGHATGFTKLEAMSRSVVEMTKALPEAVGAQLATNLNSVLDALPSKRQTLAVLRLGQLPEATGMPAWRLQHAQRLWHREQAKQSHLDKSENGRRKWQSQSHVASESERAALSKLLLDEQRAREARIFLESGEKEAQTAQARAALPITAVRAELIAVLQRSQVVVLSGGTATGKSTQVPQYLLDDAISRGEGASCRVLVTQPRRVATVRLAQRVAWERGEVCGHSVGYTTRSKSQLPRITGGSIEYVTTGVLLRRVLRNADLQGISHVIVDETHERDINIDFALVLLRKMLERRPELKVILMSASLDVDRFSKYFGGCPQLSIPSQHRFPVEEIYLEDLTASDWSKVPAIGGLYNHLEDLISSDGSKVPGRVPPGESPLPSNVGAKMAQMLLNMQKKTLEFELSEGGKPAGAPMPSKQVKQSEEKKSMRSLMHELVAETVRKVFFDMEEGQRGSVLCFLPGMPEISAVAELLDKLSSFERRHMIILKLHSRSPQAEQELAFESIQPGTLRVILATNIAESSITIDDVLCVVDTGLAKEMDWEAESQMSVLQTVSASRASCIQRKGRAGRLAPGKCYRLFSRAFLKAMPERPTPEILRMPLELTCLRICSLTDQPVREFLGEALDPPPVDTIDEAIEQLKALDVIESGTSESEASAGNDFSAATLERLTPLGSLLALLPTDPAIGRMLVMSCIMGCVNRALSAAACFMTDAFEVPSDKQEEAIKARHDFSSTSDFLAMVYAYEEWERIYHTRGPDAASRFAFHNFLSVAKLLDIRSARERLEDELAHIGLIPRHSTRDKSWYTQRELLHSDRNWQNEALLLAVFSSAFPTNLATVSRIGIKHDVHKKVGVKTRGEPKVSFYPRSVNAKEEGPPLATWFSYRSLFLAVGRPMIMDTSIVIPEQVLLFGGLKLAPLPAMPSQLMLDDWIMCRASHPESLSLLKEMREDIRTALMLKALAPESELPDAFSSVLDAAAELVAQAMRRKPKKRKRLAIG